MVRTSPSRSRRSAAPPARFVDFVTDLPSTSRGGGRGRGQGEDTVNIEASRRRQSAADSFAHDLEREIQENEAENETENENTANAAHVLDVGVHQENRPEEPEEIQPDPAMAVDPQGVEDEVEADNLGEVEEERFLLHGRDRPIVPPPIQETVDTSSWDSIRKLGGWKAFLVEFPMLGEVSEQHKGAWCSAWSESLRRWKDATTEFNRDTALMWMGFWAQALQRKPMRGGRQGRVEVASRYSCVLQRDWAGLIERWERDKLKRATQLAKRREERAEEEEEIIEQRDLARQRKMVLGLIEQGQLGRAMGRVTSHGLGDISNNTIKEQLTQKFPPRWRPLPASVSKVNPVDSFRSLRDSFLSLDPGTAPGSGGLRNEYLFALGERMEDEEIKMFEEFGLAYAKGELPSWFYLIWQSLQTVAPFKDENKEAVRPLGLKNSLTKVLNKEVMVQSKGEIREYLEPIQLGICKAGSALLTRAVSGVLHNFRDFICFRLDLMNAFNEISRRAVIDVISSVSSLSHLETFTAAILSPVAVLETGGRQWGETGEGMGQGDPPSGDLFSVGLHPDLLELDRVCRQGGGQARAGHDDVFAQGPANIVIPAVVRFATAIWERCHLQLQWSKSHIFTWDGVLPQGTPEGVKAAGKILDGTFEVGFDCYGVPMGTDKYIMSELMVSAKKIAVDAVKARELLSCNKQALWSSLRLSISQRFQYLCQHVHPSLCEPIAAWLDTQMWLELEAITGFTIPRGDRGQEGDMVINVPVEGLEGRSFQEWAIRLPIKLHGWGLRRLEEICLPAYLGTLETSIPQMGEISPIMTGVWGGVECWGNTADMKTRWSKVLSSGCQEGIEMTRGWEVLTKEARETADWLGKDIEKVFSTPLAGLGNGSVSGKTRGDIMSAREKTRSLLMSKALSQHRPKRDRAAWAWRQRDKISSSWLLALPGPDSTLSNAEFSEASATSLCMASPGCMGRVGDTVKGRKKIDKYGDTVQATSLPGDHWRQRHDQLKMVLYRLCVWAGLPCEVEVFNLFARHIPQDGLARIENNRDRQGMVPDFKITLTMGGQSRQVLHELKCISSSQSRYRPSWKERGVDRRAGELHDEYVDKARKADQVHGGVQPGQVGGVENKLLSFPKVEGIVFGNWGEASEATHSLVEALATSRAKVAEPQARKKGKSLSEEGVKSLAVGFIRRRLGVAAVKAQCHSLLGRLDGLGPGAVPAADRRRRAKEQERLWARERRAFAISARQGFNLIRHGFGKLD